MNPDGHGTAAAADDALTGVLRRFRGLALRAQLIAAGVHPGLIATNLSNLTWRRIGPLIVLHYGPLTPEQQLRAAVAGHGQKAGLASFSALRRYGLTGFDTGEIHVAAPRGTKPFQHPELPPIILHIGTDIPRSPLASIEPAATAALRAADSCASQRLSCGLLAAVVDQGLARPEHLLAQSAHSPVRHGPAIAAALADMAQHEQALEDIDLTSICRGHQLPAPALSQVRRDRAGRRRYLEVVWELGYNRTFVIEIDCAIHRAPRRWWEAQLQPKDLMISANGVLRVPTSIVRHEPDLFHSVLHQALTGLRPAS